MRVWIVCLAFAVSGAAAADPPTDRASLAARLHADHPGWPGDMIGLLADAGGQVGEGAPCALVDWMLDPISGVTDIGALRAVRIAQPACSLPLDDVSAGSVAAKLGGEPFRIEVSGNALTMIAKSEAPKVKVCCSVHASLKRLGDGPYWAGRWRMADIDHALLFIGMEDSPMPDGFRAYRGQQAPAAPRETDLKALHGKLFERELASTALGETRKLMIYLPPGYSPAQTWPVVFLTDGGAVEYAPMVEAAIEAGEMRPMVLVSSESAPEGIVGKAPTQYGPDLRAADYLKGGPSDERFRRHMQFFADELVDWATATYNLSTRRDDRVVAGESNGGVFAMWAGDMHPGVFGSAVAMSPGYIIGEPGDVAAKVRAAFYFSAGRYEPTFLWSAQKAEAELRAKGYTASGQYLTAGHSHDQWVIVLHDALKQIFPPN